MHEKGLGSDWDFGHLKKVWRPGLELKRLFCAQKSGLVPLDQVGLEIKFHNIFICNPAICYGKSFELLRSISLLCFQACAVEWWRGKPWVFPSPSGGR